jgi:hypothetical protein
MAEPAKTLQVETPVELLIKTVVRRALMRAYDEEYAMAILEKLLKDVRSTAQTMSGVRHKEG